MFELGLQSNKTDVLARTMYDNAIQGIVDHLLRRSSPSGSLYVIRLVQGKEVHIMDHLSCFLPGTLALGAHGPTHDRDVLLAVELIATCHDMYACFASGLSPESVLFRNGTDFIAEDSRYFLRPETVESLYYLFRKTGNPLYR